MSTTDPDSDALATDNEDENEHKSSDNNYFLNPDQSNSQHLHSSHDLLSIARLYARDITSSRSTHIGINGINGEYHE